MKIRLAFLYQEPGRGLIRAHITSELGTPVLIVGGYTLGEHGAIAALWAKPGDPTSAVRQVTGRSLRGLRMKVTEELGRGAWWS